jgi:nucleoside-diphosphate-sugar epimerase
MNLEGKEVLLRPGREGSVQRRLANTQKAEEILKWKADIDFRTGIRSYLSQES